MKSGISFILRVVILLTCLHCSSSDPEPELTEEEKQMERLTKTWVLGTVRYGEENISGRFDGFVLTLTDAKTYTAGGNLGDYDFEPFKASGSWDFKNNNLNLLSRNDGVDMSAQVTDNSLVLIFTMTEANGRVAGLGEYRFDLVVQ